MSLWIGDKEVGLAEHQTAGDVGGTYVTRPEGYDPSKAFYIESPEQSAAKAKILSSKDATHASVEEYGRQIRYMQAIGRPVDPLNEINIPGQALSPENMPRASGAATPFGRLPVFLPAIVGQYQNRYAKPIDQLKYEAAVRRVAADDETIRKSNIISRTFTQLAETALVPSLAYTKLKTMFSSGAKKEQAEREHTIARSDYYKSLEDKSLIGTAKGILGTLPVMAYGGGAIFKGGTLITRTAFTRGATMTATKAPRVSKLMGFGSMATEPTVTIGGLAYAGYDVHKTWKEEGLPGAAAKTTILAASIPVGYFGWKNTGQAWSRIQTRGRTEIPAPILESVMSGKDQFPSTKPGTTIKQFMRSFKPETARTKPDIIDYGISTLYKKELPGITSWGKQHTETAGVLYPHGIKTFPPATSRYGYHSTGESKGKEFTVGFPTTKTGKFQPGHKGDIPGLYISPYKYGTSPFFLRVAGGARRLKDYLSFAHPRSWLQSEALSPTTIKIKLRGVKRLPKTARTSLGAAIDAMSPGGKARPGWAYPTTALERHLSIGGGKAEAEAVISPGTVLKRTGKGFFYKYNGYRIALDEYAAQAASRFTKQLKTQGSAATKTKDMYYRRSVTPPRPIQYPRPRSAYRATRGYTQPRERYTPPRKEYPRERTQDRYTPPRGRYTPTRDSYPRPRRDSPRGYVPRGTYSPPRPPNIRTPDKIPPKRKATSAIFSLRKQKKGSKSFGVFKETAKVAAPSRILKGLSFSRKRFKL